MRIARGITLIASMAWALAGCSSSDDGKGLFEPCGAADECSVEPPGDGVVCVAGPGSSQKICSAKCSDDVDEAKGYEPVAVGDCIGGLYQGGGTVCGSGCCYIESSTQQDATDTRYAVTGICLPKAP